MFDGKKILAIGAHPDDIEYGCFGTLYKNRLTSKIGCYIATAGGANDDTSGVERLQHSNNALDFLKPEYVAWRHEIGDLQEKYAQITAAVEKIILNHKVEVILTHTFHDTHQDHRTMFDITLSAARRLPVTILAYAPLSSTPRFQPTIFVDISSAINAKRMALNYHFTQHNKSYMKTKYLEIYHSDSFASLHGFSCVERFELIRAFL